MEWVSMLGCLGNVRPYMLETILFLIFRLSDFKDMSNLKIESTHLKLSRSVSIDRLKKARTYRTQREVILNNKKTREEIISISTTIDDFKKVSKNRNKPDSKKRNTTSKETLQEQRKEKRKKLSKAEEELIQRYSIYMEQLSRSQNLQRWTNSKSKRHGAQGTTRETLERNTTRKTRRREGSGEETGEQERERERENGA